jgi:hypothetical protein
MMTVHELVWPPSGAKVCLADGMLRSMPSTPEQALRPRHVADFLAARQVTSQLLGGGAYKSEDESSLPAWARLPSNECEASGDLDDMSTQDSRSSGSASIGSMSHLSTFDSFPAIAPATPPRLVSNPSSAMLLHDSPYAAAFGHSLSGQPEEAICFNKAAADFDCFATPSSAPSGATASGNGQAAAVLLPAEVGSCEFGMADSSVSDMSALDLMLEELSSQRELMQDICQLPAFDNMWDI